jgi:hypothetical protein
MSKAQVVTIVLAFLAAAPAAGICIWSIGKTVMELADPCATWDYPADRPVYLHVGPHDVCREPSVHVESRASAIARSAIFPGGVLTAAILAVAGAALLRRRWMIAAGVGMLLETIVVFTIAPLTLVAGVSFLLLANRVRAAGS